MLEIILYLFSAFNLSVYIYLLFATGKRISYSKAHRSFFVLMISSILWISVRVLENTFEQYWELFINLDFALASLVSYALVIFALHYPRENYKITFFKEILLFIPIIILSTLSFFNVYYEIFSYRVIEYSSNYILYILILIIYFIGIGGTLFIKKLLKSKGNERIQLRYISFGYLSSISILLFDSIYTAIEGARSVEWDFLFFNATVLFAIMIAYAMLRYRFMDFRVVIRKSVIYGISLIITLAIYTYLVLVIKNSIEESWNVNSTWTAVILVALVALGFPPLKTLVEKIINKYYKGRKSIDLAVAEVKEKLSHETDFGNLINIIKKEIKEYLGIENIQFFVLDKMSNILIENNGDGGKSIFQKNNLIKYFEKYDEVLIIEEIAYLLNERSGKFEKESLQLAEKEMKKFSFNLVIPVKTDQNIIALIGLSGESRSYTVQDVNFLNKLREQITFAIANAFLYKEAMDRINMSS